MSGGNLDPLSKQRLLKDYYRNMSRAYTSMREAFKLRSASGLTQDKIAALLDVHKGLVSKRLRGDENLTLKSMSAIATAMDCGLQITFEPYEEFGTSNYFYSPGGASDPPLPAAANNAMLQST